MIDEALSSAAFGVPDSAHVGPRILFYDRLASTNTHALALAEDRANDGLVILAREQSAGRGQHGRTWLAPPGSSVLMSVLLFPPAALRQPALLTAWAAVSVCELIHEIAGLQARIKWPNDVLLCGRKVCGILIEQRSAGEGTATVAGIGLNVKQAPAWFAAAELPEAASLALLAGRDFDCREVATKLIQRLDDEYQRLRQGDLAALETRWKQHLGLLDKQVTIECLGQVHQGWLREIAFTGVDLEADGGRITVAPEMIRHISE